MLFESVGLQGLENRLGHPAGIVLVVTQSGQHSCGVHMLHVGVITIGIAMHVCQFACRDREKCYTKERFLSGVH